MTVGKVVSTFCLVALALMAHAGDQASLIKAIIIRGNERVSKEAIAAAMRTKVGQPFVQDTLDRDKQSLEDLGFFDKVDVRGTPLDSGNWQINVDLHEFPVVKEFRISGNTALKTDDILKALTLKAGDVYNVIQSRASAVAIEALYQKKGFFARVVEFAPLAQSVNTINIVITETKVGTVSVQGNRRTKDYVMRRLIKTRPGQTFSVEKWTSDLRRLYNTQWFETVTPQDDQPDIGVVNLTASVKEARTGQFSFGVQVDPQSSVAGVLKLSDSNFNGTGQSLGIDLTQATQGGGASAGLDYGNPFYDSRDTTLRASIYSRLIYRFSGTFGQSSSITSANTYSERRTGTSVGFSRPITDKLSYGISGRFENVQTNDIGTNVTDFIQQDGNVSVLTLAGTINRRDVDTDPSRGDYAHLSLEPGYADITKVGGQIADASVLGGNSFFKSTLEYRRYFTKEPARTVKDLEAPRHVLAMRARLGTINGKVPFFEQYFAGGPDTLRGYPDDRFWGRNQFLLNFEYRYPLQRAFSLIPFVDYGGAWGGFGSVNDYSQSTSPNLHVGYGAGLSFKIPGLGNIRLDLGFDEQGKSRTHFQIGAPF